MKLGIAVALFIASCLMMTAFLVRSDEGKAPVVELVAARLTIAAGRIFDEAGGR